MRTRRRRCGMTGPAAAWTGTLPTSSPPTSQAPPGNGMPAGKLRPAAAAAGGATRGRESRSPAAVTHCDVSANANRR
jgi:hypothetical protein